MMIFNEMIDKNNIHHGFKQIMEMNRAKNLSSFLKLRVDISFINLVY
jgi:hypothetical protein